MTPKGFSKIVLVVIVVLVVVAIALVLSGREDKAEEIKEVGNTVILPGSPLNATYKIEGDAITLTDGKSETETPPASAS